uniref:Rab-GAP TBC domain-containing protein n=1 Tax=Ciona savignyi TaxID=51511 RepID=H2YR54_CIOSA
MLIRMGIPHQLRPQVWSWMVERRVGHIRMKLDADGSYYSKLVKSKDAQLPSKQIELDLLRTLPNNRHFSSMSCDGVEQLRSVLRAYSIHNPAIGYCQGLNRVAAVALLYLCEEDAFWCVVALVEHTMPPDYYSTTLTASQADQRVFRDLLSEKLPRLHRHFEAAGVDTSLITFNWFLCIYCDNVPAETMLHVWDVLLSEGSKVLFRFGLAFFKSVEEEILQLPDYISIFNYLRVMSHRMHDVRLLTQIAFQALNPFPMRKINRLRAIHLDKVNTELQELDAIRKGFVSVRKNIPDPDAESDEDS